MAKKAVKSLTACLKETIQILDDLSGKLQMERIFHNITQKLYEQTDCQTCAIIRLQPGNERLEIVNSQGLSWQFCKKFRQQEVHPVIQELLWQENPLMITAAEDNAGAVKDYQLEHSFGSCYCVPLLTNKKPAGYLFLDSREADHFSGDDLLMAQLYAKIIAAAILKTDLLQALEHRSEITDHTGAILYNVFYSRLSEAIAKAARQHEPVSLILLDIVKFDKLLTLYGDQVCRQLLDELIVTVTGSLRTYDMIARFGTDELILSLPGHSVGEAAACTRKLQEIIIQKMFTDKKVPIEVSIGIAGYPENAATPAGLLTAVKNALMESKRTPDHRIWVAGDHFA